MWSRNDWQQDFISEPTTQMQHRDSHNYSINISVSIDCFTAVRVYAAINVAEM
jgi:hypothetical protein